MKKLLFLFILLFPTFVFGQTFVGLYKANFNANGLTERTEVEFEIFAGGAVSGNIKTRTKIIKINGQIDSFGNLEAKSERESGTIYTLKANLDRGNGKINLTERFEETSAGKQGFSQTYAQGIYQKIEKDLSSENAIAPSFEKTELIIEQPNPLFEKEFTVNDAEIRLIKEEIVNVYHFQMIIEGNGFRRAFYFSLSRMPNSPQKVWKIENIRFIRYLEKTDNLTKTNNFHSDYDKWQKHREILAGEIELLQETSRQMVFKVSNLRFKNMLNDEIIIINGTVSAKIVK